MIFISIGKLANDFSKTIFKTLYINIYILKTERTLFYLATSDSPGDGYPLS